MLKILGFVIVTGSVFGGYVLSHGELMTLWQPFELLIIGGGAFGAFVISNSVSIIKATFRETGHVIMGKNPSKAEFMDLLTLLYELFNKSRRSGLMAIEEDIENPQESEIFIRFPRILADDQMRNFICDYMRIITTGNLSAFELETLMDQDIETTFQEMEQPAASLSRVADALPGFGIVAAVLGIVITMKSLGGAPEELGYHVAAALVGTFLGVLLAYGFVGPMSVAMEHAAKEKAKALECIKTTLLASVNGIPPHLSVEFGRKTLYSEVRPSFTELEEHLRGR